MLDFQVTDNEEHNLTKVNVHNTDPSYINSHVYVIYSEV